MSNKTKIGRNDPCPCGSGKKYKHCCAMQTGFLRSKNFLDEPFEALAKAYHTRYGINLKTPEQIEGIRKCGDLVVATLDLVEKHIRPGITTDEINTLVHEFTLEHNAIPADLGYRGYTKSTCTSINEVICHGIPSERKLLDGDIVNVDITSILDGYYADASKTYFVGAPSADALKIVSVARESLKRGLEMVCPGNTLGDIGWAIQNYAEREMGCAVVREFVGHGLGLNFHENPQVLHYGRKGDGVPLVPGMVFTIEPMINLGTHKLKVLDDGWTAVTLDGTLSAQFEQTIVVTKDGYDVLTPFDL